MSVVARLRGALIQAALDDDAVGLEGDLDVAPHALEHGFPPAQQLADDHLSPGMGDNV